MQDEEEEPLPKLELTPFAQGLADRIMRDGPMTLTEYMEKTVTHYYASRKPFGKEGDFVTSPDLSQMFGELIGAWIADLWMQMGRPRKAQLVELGPGSGTLSADILRALKTWPDCAAAFSLHLVENSPSLREQQTKLLKAYKPRHYERLEQVPEKGPSFTVANEFLDALPIVSYERTKGKWHERLVSFNAETGAFYFALSEKAAEPVIPKGYPKPMDRDVLEISPVSHEIIRTVCNRLNAGGGAALFIDYGELDPNFSDTLAQLPPSQDGGFGTQRRRPGCHRRRRFHVAVPDGGAARRSPRPRNAGRFPEQARHQRTLRGALRGHAFGRPARPHAPRAAPPDLLDRHGRAFQGRGLRAQGQQAEARRLLG